MKIFNNIYCLIGIALTCCFCLTCCTKAPHSDSTQNKESVEPANLVSAGEPQSPLKFGGFSGVELLPKLGAVLSTSMLEELQKLGDLPELKAAALESGGKCYVLGVNSGGGQVLHLGRDNALLAFGYSSNADQTPSDEERGLLTEFKLSGQPIVTVLDEKFEAVKMPIQTYESKVLQKKHALMYSKGRRRTLVFFDSTRVEIRKLLPASPDTIDPAMLKHLRSLLEPTK